MPTTSSADYSIDYPASITAGQAGTLTFHVLNADLFSIVGGSDSVNIGADVGGVWMMDGSTLEGSPSFSSEGQSATFSPAPSSGTVTFTFSNPKDGQDPQPVTVPIVSPGGHRPAGRRFPQVAPLPRQVQ